MTREFCVAVLNQACRSETLRACPPPWRDCFGVFGMDKNAIHERAGRLRRVQRLTSVDWPPDPEKIVQAIEELLALSDVPQDRVQRKARERLVTACQDYVASKGTPDELAGAVRNAWHLVEVMWRDEKGRMIPPDFLTRS